MTRCEFDQLPLLLTREQVLAVLHVDDRTLAKVRAADPGLSVQVPGLKRTRYRKSVLAKYVTLCEESPQGAVGRSS